MKDCEGFPIEEECTRAKRVPLEGKLTLCYMSFPGRVLTFGKGTCRWHAIKVFKIKFSPNSGKTGIRYLQMGRHKSDYLYNKYVHHLQAMAWLEPGELWQTQIDHIDGNRFNNRADNLRRCNNQENKRYALAIKKGETIISNLQKARFYAGKFD